MTRPFLRAAGRLWCPPEMTTPPLLDESAPAGNIQPRYALLINPFYPKDPNASFGKHVLTPTLALTSFAATTPAHWQLRYWDENLLDGRPPFAPMPDVVGITVHLTFAARAFELAQWYRSRGSKVVLGGLHVLSCPQDCAPYADALALGDGVQLWPCILDDVERGCLRAVYSADYETDYRSDPAPRRSLLPRSSFLTTTSLIATYADALALGDGVQLWPCILAEVERGCLRAVYSADYETDYRSDPAPRRSLLPRSSFLTTT